jgi:hypothetical protein
MGSAAAQEQLYARLAWFLAGAYPGASKRKRIARDFRVSPDTAKGWLCGYAWPRHDTFLAMRAKWGAEFVAFVYQCRAEMDAMEARVARLEREMRLEDARGNAIAHAAVEAARGGAEPGAAGRELGGANEAQADPVAPPVKREARR